MSGYSPEKDVGQQHYQYQQPQQFHQPFNTAAPPPPGMGGPYATGTHISAGTYPGVTSGPPTQFMDPTQPRPNDILPLHPVIIQQRQIAATLPPCPKGGYHELRARHALGFNAGTFLSVICFPIVCCCVKEETVCIKCKEKFDIVLPRIH